MIKLNCKICNKEFYIYNCRIEKRKHCSKECYNFSLIGKIPWSKGLKTGPNPEHSKRMSGKNHPNYGKRRSQRTKNRISKANKGNPRLIRSIEERWKNQEFKEMMRKIQKKRMEELWQDSEYASKTIKAFHLKPNKPEIFLTNFLQEILPNEYKYVGDGQFILAGKCPDFMNINGKKKLIELYGDYWHRNDNPQDRIAYFKEHGFDTLVIWESELKDNNLRERIAKFNL